MFKRFVMTLCTGVALLSFIMIFIFCLFGLDSTVIIPVIILGGISCVIAIVVDKYI